jgi:hypothetical protein
MSRANEQRCVHCNRGAKVRITRAGALCKRCLDHYPKHLRLPPVADPGPAAVPPAPADDGQHATDHQHERGRR